MAPPPPAPLWMTSQQWLARIRLVATLVASEVVIAAACGVGWLRLAVLAVAALAFLLGYLVAPSPCKARFDRSDLRPLVGMLVASVAAIAVTGGLAGPLLPLAAAPFAMFWTTFRAARAPISRRAGNIAYAVVPAVLLAALAAPLALPPIAFTRVQFAVLAGWTSLLTIWLIGRRIARLFEALSAAMLDLVRVREGALSDAASRRRGLESMTTKLAHELKNPLAAIKSLVQVELGAACDDKSRRRLDVVFAETERIGTILREYLDLARPVEAMQIQPVQLDELMAEVGTLLAGRAEAAGVVLSVGGTGGSLHADARLLKEAIVNLASNAIEATPRGGTVAVTYALGELGARIVVRDSGEGMSKDVSCRVGTPFFTTRAGGTGLGVAIARSAIAQHRGRLDYASAPGAGTTVTIALPLDPCAAHDVAA